MLTLMAALLIVMMVGGLIGNRVELGQFGRRRVAKARVVGVSLVFIGCIAVAFRVIAVGL